MYRKKELNEIIFKNEIILKNMKISLLILSALLLNLNVFAQSVGINANGSAPNSSAMLDVSSTSSGFLPPRMTNAQKTAIGSPVAGLIVWCSDCGANGELQVFNGYNWTNLTGGSAGVLSFTVTHLASGGVAPVDKVVTYGTVTSSLSGASKRWITQNLGSDHQATSATDATEASAGWYWQFNRKQGFKHDGTTRTPNTTWVTSISENSEWTAANDPCTIELGTGWRIPTSAEWTYAAGPSGGNWANYTDTYASVLKLHAAGYLNGGNGSLNGRGANGNYWSSTQFDASNGWALYFISNGSGMNVYGKAYGFPLRCLRD